MENNNEDYVEIDLGELFSALLSKIWIVIAATLLCAAILADVTYFWMTPVYTATSTIYVLPKENETTTYSDIQVGTQMTNDAVQLAKSKSVINAVIDDLDLEYDYDTLKDMISVNNTSDTRLIDISVENEDPQLAADIANAMSNFLADSVEEILVTDRPTIAEKAEVPEKPSGPSMVKNTIIGALIGFIIACAFIIIQFLRDDTIKTAEDVEKYLGLNTLASIPLEYNEDEKATKKKTKKAKKIK